MKSMSRIAIILAMTFVVSCVDASPELPRTAHSTRDGVRWITLQSGCGLTGGEGQFWSVDWSSIPTDDFGQHVYNGAINTPLYDPFRSKLDDDERG
jgi:hypothetical protein